MSIYIAVATDSFPGKPIKTAPDGSMAARSRCASQFARCRADVTKSDGNGRAATIRAAFSGAIGRGSLAFSQLGDRSGPPRSAMSATGFVEI